MPALVDRVVSKTAQHDRLCRCLADAGWSNLELHLLIVGHRHHGFGQCPSATGLGSTPFASAASLGGHCRHGLQFLMRDAQGLLARIGRYLCPLSRCTRSCCCAFAGFNEWDSWEATTMLIAYGC